MKKLTLIALLALFAVLISSNSAKALINLDDESVKIAIKYGLDNKYSTTKDLLGPNWIEGEGGILITIFSPFIQLASKAKSQNVPGSSDEDIILVKRRLGRQMNQITTRQEVRFIVQLVGDDEGTCKGYEAHIEEILNEEDFYDESGQEKTKGFWFFKKKASEVKAKKITPEKVVKQNSAELDHYNPVHPYSCTNSYNFNFEKVNKYEKFNFVLKGPDDKEIKFVVDKNAIF